LSYKLLETNDIIFVLIISQSMKFSCISLLMEFLPLQENLYMVINFSNKNN